MRSAKCKMQNAVKISDGNKVKCSRGKGQVKEVKE